MLIKVHKIKKRQSRKVKMRIPSSLYPVQSLFSHHCQGDQQIQLNASTWDDT
jgi:hypothetical protein